MMMADYIGTVSLFSRYKVEESNPELFKKENAEKTSLQVSTFPAFT